MVSWGQTGGPSLSLGGSHGPQLRVTQDVSTGQGLMVELGRRDSFKSSSAPDSKCSWSLAKEDLSCSWAHSQGICQQNFFEVFCFHLAVGN